MTPERWQEVEEIYQAAADLEEEARQAFLAVACKNEVDLRREVESLLKEEGSSVLVDRPAWETLSDLLGDNEDLPPGTQLGPYRIEAVLGSGGMGDVYQALDTRLGRFVALKMSKVQFSERFEREARAVAALNHPNICTLYDVGPNYLVMELVEGPTLADRIAQAPVSLDEGLSIARQIAAALDAAHKLGIVHRDVKPGNIKIKPDGTVKVLDFGLAKVGGKPAAHVGESPVISTTETQVGLILGTAAYVSPEQASGKPVDKRTDIWAFGVVLYEMLTGRKLFAGDSNSKTFAAILREEPDLNVAPPKVRRLLRSCLQKDPDHRLRDIADAELLLEVAPEVVSAGRPWLAWSMAALLLVLAPIAFVHFQERLPVPAGPVRFEIPLPAGLTLGPPAFSVSPDGRQMVFVAAGSDGIRRLWLRALDAVEATPIAGSETTRTGFRHVPFWSPDSRYVVFDAGGRLKKIDLLNGLVQTLCEVSRNVAGGSWNRDGVIIFGLDSAGHGLMRVSSAGGQPSLVTKDGTPAREILPIFLPDGQHFLFMRVDGPLEGIYAGSIDLAPEQQPSNRLLESDSGPLYVTGQGAAIGHLLFTRNETLLAQPFDADRLQVVGQPMQVAEDVGTAARVGLISASNSNVLVYMNYGRNRQLTWFDRQGKILGRVDRHGELATWIPNLFVTHVSISPDGRRVAFSRNTRRRESAVWVADLATGAGFQLSFLPGMEEQPIWAPDGSRVAFTNFNGEGRYGYYKIASGAGKEELLINPKESGGIADWSADGRGVLLSRADGTTSDLWLQQVEGGGAERATTGGSDERFSKLSPDQQWIAYVSDESGKEEIYVVPFAPHSPHPEGKWKVSSDGGTRVRWRRDGKEIFYMTPAGTIMAVNVKTDQVFQPDPPRALFRTESDPTGWDVSPDGQRFLVAVPDESPVNPFVVLLNWPSMLQH